MDHWENPPLQFPNGGFPSPTTTALPQFPSGALLSSEDKMPRLGIKGGGKGFLEEGASLLLWNAAVLRKP